MRGIHGVRTTFLRDVFIPFGDCFSVFWIVFVRFAVFLIVSVPLRGFRVVLIRLCFGVVHFVPIPVGVRSGPLTIVRSRLGSSIGLFIVPVRGDYCNKDSQKHHNTLNLHDQLDWYADKVHEKNPLFIL